MREEHFFELKVGFCEKCTMVQLTELVDEKKMFHENYAFFSSTSTRMAQHFKEFADMVRGFVNRHNDFSYYNDVEINDYMMGSITVINRWLMLQGSDVPLRYREKISFL